MTLDLQSLLKQRRLESEDNLHLWRSDRLLLWEWLLSLMWDSGCLAQCMRGAIDWALTLESSWAHETPANQPFIRDSPSAFNCDCRAEGCCFNILYRFLCNTLTWRPPRARIDVAEDPPFVKSQSCFNDAWRNIQALTFLCQVSLVKSMKIIPFWPSYPVNAY